MQAYRLKSGAIVYPRRAELEDGGLGDGLALAHEGTEEHATWAAYTVPAPPKIEELAAELARRTAAKK